MRTAIRKLYDNSYKPKDTTEAANETALTHSGDFDDCLEGILPSIVEDEYKEYTEGDRNKRLPTNVYTWRPSKMTAPQCDSLPMTTLQYQR